MAPKRIVLAGGSGFLGQALAQELVKKGCDVVVLTRAPGHTSETISYVQWDGKSLGSWSDSLNGADAVVNLTGKSVNCRYTPSNRREIVESRVNSVNIIGQAILKCSMPPKVWVQAASLAIYGDAGSQICDESTPPGHGFSPETCVTWEKMFNAVCLPNTRKVLLRIGFALDPQGGALGTLVRLTRYFLGGAAGSGKQFISWLHIADLNRIFIAAIEHTDWDGVFIADSPTPMTNAEFMHTLRAHLNRPWSPPIPGWAVGVGSWLLGTESELILTGRRCLPTRLLDKGFVFEYPRLDAAMKALQLNS